MFEDKTFENILSEMLSYVSDRNPELDTRVGSIVYTALAPIALELETAYHEMQMIMDETFLDTASKEYLAKFGQQFGVPINEATCAHFKGEFDVDVEIGSRFNLDQFNYTVVEKLSAPTEDYRYYTFDLVCENAGAEANDYLGRLTPITYVRNLSHAQLIEIISYGEDEEDEEAYRYRLQIHVNKPPVNGNVNQYNEWLDNYDGIGKYRVTPCWDGQNSVKVTILDTEDGAASPELVAEVQEYFDPNCEGMGNGVAPIGAMVTVDTVTEVPVKVDCTVVLKEGYSEPVGVQDAVDECLKAMVLTESKVKYWSIFMAISNAESVKEVVSLSFTIKGGTTMASGNLNHGRELEDNEIPVLDTENSVWSVQ